MRELTYRRPLRRQLLYIGEANVNRRAGYRTLVFVTYSYIPISPHCTVSSLFDYTHIVCMEFRDHLEMFLTGMCPWHAALHHRVPWVGGKMTGLCRDQNSCTLQIFTKRLYFTIIGLRPLKHLHQDHQNKTKHDITIL